MDVVPVEIVWEILTFLSPYDILNCLTVSKSWNSIGRNNNFWKVVYCSLLKNAELFQEEDILQNLSKVDSWDSFDVKSEKREVNWKKRTRSYLSIDVANVKKLVMFSTGENGEEEIAVKFIMLGCGGIGKRGLVRAYVGQKFESRYIATVGCDVRKKMIDFQDTNVALELMTTGGEEKFSWSYHRYYPICYGYVVCFDLTYRDSFNHACSLIRWLFKDLKNPNVVLVGCKCDLGEQKVKDRRIEHFIRRERIKRNNNIKFYKTSAKERINVENPFEYLLSKIVRKFKMTKPFIEKGKFNFPVRTETTKKK